jgi:hypothetical protein
MDAPGLAIRTGEIGAHDRNDSYQKLSGLPLVGLVPEWF